MSNTEIVKWIELWLDSAGERAYQSAFVSSLAYSGYKIIHNTSHNSLELGKDVICFSPEGELCALQLKGNPGSRFTMSQWHALQAQILQLVLTPIPSLISGKKGAKHRPILVTNGEIEEDVQAAIVNFNTELVAQYKHAKSLEIWTRGILISQLSKVANSVWPTNLVSQLNILKSITISSGKSINLREFDDVVRATLGWDEDRPSFPRQIERVLGLSTVISVYVYKYIQDGNYFEAIKAKTIALCMVASYWHRHRSNRYKNESGLGADKLAIFDFLLQDLYALLGIFSEAIATRYAERPHYNGHIFGEFGVYASRRMLVTAVLAVHALIKGQSCSDVVRSAIGRRVDYKFIGGEGIIPAFLSLFWAKENFDASRECDIEMVSVLNALINMASYGPNVSSYYSLEEETLFHYRDYLGRGWHHIEADERIGMSQFAYVCTLLLVKRNWKKTAKNHWSEITHIVRQETILDNLVEFPFFRSSNAREITKLVQIPRTWDELVEEASRPVEVELPFLLKKNTFLVALFLIFMPHRATEDIVLWLDRELCDTWY